MFKYHRDRWSVPLGETYLDPDTYNRLIACYNLISSQQTFDTVFRNKDCKGVECEVAVPSGCVYGGAAPLMGSQHGYHGTEHGGGGGSSGIANSEVKIVMPRPSKMFSRLLQVSKDQKQMDDGRITIAASCPQGATASVGVPIPLHVPLHPWAYGQLVRAQAGGKTRGRSSTLTPTPTRTPTLTLPQP